MFQAREPQESLWQSEFLITPRKAKLMRRSWAEVFGNEALVLIEEERFAPMYSPDMGRPNRAVQTVLGVLVLKEMFDLTDMEALEELEFNLLWHHALRLEMEEAHLAQKTLHNFRVRLMEHDGGRLALRDNGPDDRGPGTVNRQAAPGLDARHDQYRGVDAVGSVLRDGPSVRRGVPDHPARRDGPGGGA